LATAPWDLTDPRDDRSLPPWFRRAVVLVLALIVAMRVVLWGFGELQSFWYILFLAFFIGLTLEPAVGWLYRRGMRRGLATILVMLGLGLATVAFFAVFGNLLVTQLAQLISGVPDLLNQAVARINERFGTDLTTDSILDSLGIGASDLAQVAADLGLGLLSVITTAVGLVFNLFTVALFAFYFAAEGPRFRATVASWLPPSRQRTVLAVWDIATQKAGGYVISRGILALVSAAFHGIVFLLVDLPYWLPLALWVGLVSQFVPTIGTYLAGALPITIALVQGEWVVALIILAAVVGYQQVENYFIAPRVTKSTLEIHPAVAFGSVLVGGTLFGAMGALLAIPVVATIQAVIMTYGRRYELVQEVDGVQPAADDAAPPQP
jgi:predicted PurR-regulated permease PerM